MYLGGAAGAIWGVLYPSAWAILYQAPIAFVVTYLVLMTDARVELESRTALTVAALAGAGGALVFQAIGLFTSILAVILGPVLLWVNVSFVTNFYLDTDNITLQNITQKIMIPLLLIWIIIGVPIYILRG